MLGDNSYQNLRSPRSRNHIPSVQTGGTGPFLNILTAKYSTPPLTFLCFPEQSWGAGVFGSLEPEPLEKKTRSRSRLEKKSGARAEAAKKLAGSSALQEDKKHKEIVRVK